MKPPTATEHWPRLSVDLKHERNPFICQACGFVGLTETGDPGAPPPEPEDVCLQRWQEHDQQDRPQPIIVVLCKECADRLIEPHERLYARLDKWAPALGAMRFCLDCANRDGLHCAHPDSKENGGPGLALIMPNPTRAHLNYGGGRGEWKYIFLGPVTRCVGWRQNLRRVEEYASIIDMFDKLP